MKEIIIFLSLISLFSISSALPHFTFSGIESFHDCSGEKEKISLFIIGSLSEEVGAVTLPNYNIEQMGDFQCALSKNEGEKDPARSHVITCTIEGNFEPKAFILDEPKVNGFDFLNEKGESTWPDEPEKATFLIGECGERVELDKETLFLEKTEKSGLLAGAAYEDPVKTIRKDIVDKALKALPARSKTTKEVMMKRMKSVRTLYSLSDIEAAYMVYKWEYENLQYDCYHYNHDRDLIDFTEDGTYKSGVGVCNGFAYLYARLCNAMGVEAYRVVGYSKAGDFVKGVTPTSSDHAWNVIQIDGNYYLLDATWGIGSCNGDAYVPKLRDSYFCTKPEAFIRTHLPVEKKYQLVYPTITLKQWSNMLEVNMEFYESGMTEISPDKAILEIDNGKIEVEITYEPPEEPLGFLYHLYHLQGHTYMEQPNACWVNKEKTRAKMICNAKYEGKYKLTIFGGTAGQNSYPQLLEYDIESTSTNTDLTGFPIIYAPWSQSESTLIEPLYNPLPRGQYVNFKIKTTTFDNLYVSIDGASPQALKNEGNGLFTGRFYVKGSQVLLLTEVGESYSYLLVYSTELSSYVEEEPEYPESFRAPPHVLHSPLSKYLKRGKTYEFEFECKTCNNIAVMDGDYDYTELTRKGDIFSGKVKIIGRSNNILLIDIKGRSYSVYYQYKVSN